MKALSLHQPFASLITEGVKRIETRGWKAPDSLIGETIAIHAAKKKPATVFESANGGGLPEWFPADISDRTSLYGRGEETADGWWFAHQWTGPLGAVVATATLADCLPMVDRRIDAGHVLVEPDELWLAEPAEQEQHEAWASETVQAAYRIDEERPFGWYEAGRWAWILTDVEPLDEPVPARGRQRVWNWEPPA